MKVNLINIGCKVNFSETSRLKEMLLEEAFEIVNVSEDADIILINTCSVTNHSESESRQIIRRSRKQNPSAFIGIFGCYAQLKPNELLETTGANAVFGINEKFQIPTILKKLIGNNHQAIFEIYGTTAAKSLAIHPENTGTHPIFEVGYSSASDSRTRGFLKLQDGCDNCCSYCTVPAARGHSRSIDFNAILPNIRKLIDIGHKEIVISGINLSDYKSNDKNFYSLVKLLSNICQQFSEMPIRFRISSIEPQIIDEELINIIANSQDKTGTNCICPHFHIPLQSGSNPVLRQMQRKYNAMQFSKKIELINKILPDAFIGLDVISGFPGETEENFEESKAFIETLNISALHCFIFSKRNGTPAATMPNQISKIEKKRRTNELLAISRSKENLFINKNLGNTFYLLPERYDKELSCVLGHTENYITTFLHSDIEIHNEFIPVKLSSIENNRVFCDIAK